MPHPIVLFLACYGALWIAFDVRMGLEMLNYVKYDYDTYLSQPQGGRIFRSYINFNDVVDLSRPELERSGTYALLRQNGVPIVAMTRYFGLPGNLIEPEGPREDVKVWLVFRREDVTMSEDGRLMVGGIPWSAPGKIERQFDPMSFLFITNQ